MLAAVAVLSSCEAVSVTPVDVASLNVDPPEATLSAGDTIRLTATPLSSDGKPFPRGTVRWTTEDPSVATVDGSGLVSAHEGGQAVVRAVFGQIEGAAAIRVLGVFRVDPERSEVLADPSVLPADGEATCVVTIRLRDSEGVQASEGGHEVTLDQAGGGSMGPLTDHGDGTYTATLTAPTVTGDAEITVRVDGTALNARAHVTFAPGPPSTVTSTLTASPESIRAGSDERSTVTVRLSDAHGNLLDRGGDRVKLRIVGRGKLGSVRDHGDGRYSAEVRPPRGPGSGTVRGELNGRPMEATVTIRFTASDPDLAGASAPLPTGRRRPGSTRGRR